MTNLILVVIFSIEDNNYLLSSVNDFLASKIKTINIDTLTDLMLLFLSESIPAIRRFSFQHTLPCKKIYITGFIFYFLLIWIAIERWKYQYFTYFKMDNTPYSYHILHIHTLWREVQKWTSNYDIEQSFYCMYWWA